MLLEKIPIPVFFFGTAIVVMIIVEIGFRFGVVVHRRSPGEKEAPVSVISGAILGLAAFMLAFSFGMVSNRHDTKKELMRNDANAIRTAWLRADFLPEPDRTEARGLLLQYVDTRLAFAKEVTLEPQRVKDALAASKQVQDRLWNTAVVNARKDMNSDVAALYIESLNEIINIHALRVSVGVQSRVEPEVWLVLMILVGLGALVVGYQTAIADSQRSMIQPVLALSFALVIALIASLDRPDSGVMRVNQTPLYDLRNAMSAEAAQPQR
jgi:hypothetical protein